MVYNFLQNTVDFHSVTKKHRCLSEMLLLSQYTNNWQKFDSLGSTTWIIQSASAHSMDIHVDLRAREHNKPENIFTVSIVTQILHHPLGFDAI